MRRAILLWTPAVCLLWVAISHGAEYRVEILEEPPPSDGVADEIIEQIAPRGFKVIKGTNRTVCEIWPCKQWQVKSNFIATSERLYPFESGQLIGLLRYRRRGSEFREEEISSGVYTLRYGLQPVDGNHEGTSPTRDFLLLVQAAEDQTAEPMELEKLNEMSAEAAESSHPAMLCLQAAEGGTDAAPSVRHNEERDWWMVHFVGQGVSDGKTRDIPVDLVVAGHADE